MNEIVPVFQLLFRVYKCYFHYNKLVTGCLVLCLDCGRLRFK